MGVEGWPKNSKESCDFHGLAGTRSKTAVPGARNTIVLGEKGNCAKPGGERAEDVERELRGERKPGVQIRIWLNLNFELI